MNTTTAAVAMIAVIVAVLAIVHVPFGDYMARVYTSPRHLRVERGMYRLVRHPMYAGYILSHIGFLIARPAWLNAGLYGLELILQVLRIQAEERVLRADPSYRSFAEQVRYRLLPGVY